MKQFFINEQQIQLIANTLLEFPAKQVLNALDVVRLVVSSQESAQLNPSVSSTPVIKSDEKELEKSEEKKEEAAA